jgi:hypothetical protein
MTFLGVSRRVVVLAVVIACALAGAARGQVAAGTAFTYQGELRSDGAVVSGAKDVRFRLFDAEVGGNAVGTELLAAGLQIVDGRFTVELDFGGAAFQGQARWLEVRVAEPGSPSYTTLSPRQSLTAAPMALYALNAPAPPGKITASVDAQFSLNDRVGWARVETLGDDTCFGSIPLGFTFTGWGRSVTQVSVSSNGLLFFGSQCSATFTNTALPIAISPDPFLAFFWDDLLDFGTNEFFEYATFGTAPGRVFNLYFRNRFLTSACGTDAVNVMITIHEGSNLIRVTYLGMAGPSGCAQIRGSAATFGLQGPGGSSAQALMISHNAPILDNDAPRQSISYQPPAD